MDRNERIRDFLEIAIGSCFMASIFFYGSEFFCFGERFVLKNSLFFYFIQAISGICAIIIPYQLRKKRKLFLSPLLYSMYLLFLFASLFLGELCNFYLLIPSWDILLHFSSGILLFFIFYEWIQKLGLKENQISFPITLILAFSCSMAIAGLWEIYEFLSDIVFGTNMQRFLAMDGTSFIGRMALVDTMSDLIFGMLGTMTGILYYLHKKDKKREMIH